MKLFIILKKKRMMTRMINKMRIKYLKNYQIKINKIKILINIKI